MSNIDKEDLAALSEKMDWSLFDQVFASGEAGMRKPNLDVFHHVLQDIKLTPEHVAFVDDKKENVLAAETLGIKALIFDHSTLNNLQTMLNGQVAKGCKYMYSNAKNFDSVTESGVIVADNFSQLLILEAMQDPWVSTQ